MFPANEEMSCQLWLDTVETHLKTKQNKTTVYLQDAFSKTEPGDAKMLRRHDGMSLCLPVKDKDI